MLRHRQNITGKYHTIVGSGPEWDLTYQIKRGPQGQFLGYEYVRTGSRTQYAQFVLYLFDSDLSIIQDDYQTYKAWRSSRIPKVVKHTTVRNRSWQMPPLDRLKNQLGDVTRVVFPPINGTPDSVYLVRPINPAYLRDPALKMFQKFATQIPEEVSIANFIIEAKDLKKMLDFRGRWATLTGLISKTTEDLKRYRRATRNDRHDPTVLQKGQAAELARLKERYGRPKTIGDVLRFVRNSFLEYSFGVRPLESDLTDFFSLFEKVEKRIEYLKKVNRRTRTIKFSTTVSIPLSHYGTSQVSQSGTTSGLKITARAAEGSDIVIHGSAMLYQDLTDLDSVVGAWRAVSTSFGLSNPTKMGWNAIPYSFVLDYFLNIGGFLDSIVSRPFTGTWELSNICHSITERTSVELVYDHVPLGGGLPVITNGYITTFAVRHYTRNLGYIDLGQLDSPTIDNPTVEQKLLIASLLDQKVRK